jgi:cell division protein FtsX
LLAGLALLIVLAGIRVRLERGAQEHRVLDLLGAGPAFSIGPTAIAGALQGIAAAALAAAALALVIAQFGDGIAHALAGAIGSAAIAFPSLAACAVFIALGGALGFVGGGLAGIPRARA